MAVSGSLVLRSSVICFVVAVTIFVVARKFDSISEAVGNLPTKIQSSIKVETFPSMLSSSSDSKSCAIDPTDFLEQKLHFQKWASDRQTAIAKPGNLPNLQTYLVPQITCPTPVRVGRIGDGGKWVCSPWRAPKEDCIIYSFGVNNEVSFETDIYEATKKRCKVISFDPGNSPESLFKPFNGTFHSWAIAGQTDVNAKRYSIADVATQLLHKKIDFLKIDIEGSEFDSFKSLFNSDVYKQGSLEICQIFIEMHTNVDAMVELHKSFQNNGFFMFYKEANHYCAPCHEYSFIHRNCSKRYGIQGEPFNLNFP